MKHPDETVQAIVEVVKAGTSDGAKKGWEKRKHGGGGARNPEEDRASLKKQFPGMSEENLKIGVARLGTLDRSGHVPPRDKDEVYQQRMRGMPVPTDENESRKFDDIGYLFQQAGKVAGHNISVRVDPSFLKGSPYHGKLDINENRDWTFHAMGVPKDKSKQTFKGTLYNAAKQAARWAKDLGTSGLTFDTSHIEIPKRYEW